MTERRRVLLAGVGDLFDEVHEALEAGRRRGARAQGPRRRRPSATRWRRRFPTSSAWSRGRTRCRCGSRCSSATSPRTSRSWSPSSTARWPPSWRTTVPHLRVVSLADVVAPSLAAPCLDPDLVGLRADDDELEVLRGGGDERRCERERRPKPRVSRCARARGERLHPLRPQRRAALLRRDRAGRDARVRDGRRDDRARPGVRRRLLRLDQVARHGRPQRRRGPEGPVLVQAGDRRLDAADAAERRLLHRRADQPAGRLAADRA